MTNIDDLMRNPNRKEIIYIYASKEIKAYIELLSKKFHLPITAVVCKIIEGHQCGRRAQLEEKKPKYVTRAEAWKVKNL
jgi:hypothetical protein